MIWYRMYHDVISDPKIQRLPIEMRWRWVELLCIASKSKRRGDLPVVEDIAYLMRVPKPRAQQIVATMIENRLVDEGKAGEPLRIHDWDQHQRLSDGSAERVQRYRERHRNVTSNVTSNEDVTLQKRSRVRPCAGAEAETDTEEEKTPPPPVDLGSEHIAAAHYAEEQGGDVSWALWAERMGRAGHPAKHIRAAIDEAAGCGKLSQGYVAKILQRWAKEGPPSERNGGSGHRPDPPIKFHRKGDSL